MGPGPPDVNGSVPPGWPRQVPPRGEQGFTERATAWLLDVCPPEYRSYPVVVRHPAALAWLAERHVRAQATATSEAIRTARGELAGEVLDQPATEAFVEALQAEQARLVGVQRAVGLLAQALRGKRYVPRL